MTSSRRLSKQIRGNKNSHTPGKLKGDTCKADWRKKFFFASPKAYKHKDYGTYHAMALSLNGQKA